MTPTLQSFLQALLTPDLSLLTLTDACVATDRSGLPLLTRTTRFAEARITWNNEQWLLSLPLTPAALPHIERMASALRRLNTDALTEYRILPGELLWYDASDNSHTTDLVLQHLPAGRTFAEALLSEPQQTLLDALDRLETDLRELGFSHNNLKADNLLWSAGRLLPLRYHDATLGGPCTADAAAFDALRREIGEASGPRQTVSDTTAPYDPLRRLEGHLWTSHVFEGLVCVEDSDGYGFVDTDNIPVIPGRFLWAGDFREGRAEVQTPTGMGLIDRQGNYVIAPEYEIVDYVPAESIAHVRSDGRWALFDYMGRRLTDFRDRTEA